MMKTAELVREKNELIGISKRRGLLHFRSIFGLHGCMKLSNYFNYVRNVGRLLKTLTRDIVAVPCPLLRSMKITNKYVWKSQPYIRK
jgi:hypothetical protein